LDEEVAVGCRQIVTRVRSELDASARFRSTVEISGPCVLSDRH